MAIILLLSTKAISVSQVRKHMGWDVIGPSVCAQTSKWELEIGCIAAFNIDYNFAFHLDAIQTPSSKIDISGQRTISF